jgi:hypothetical protein
VLGPQGFQRFKLLNAFAHHVGEMLELIADTLLPRDFAELVEHGFRDEPPAS